MRPIDERGNINLIASRMVGFIAHLRLNDFALGPAETELALRVIGGDALTIQEARQTLKILLASQHTEWQQFDDLFEAYWLQHGTERKRWQAPDNTQKTHKASLPKAWETHLAGDSFENGHQPQIETEGEQSVTGDATGRLISTDKTSLFKTDLRQFVSPDEIRDAEKLALKLAKAIRYRLSRRQRIAARGNRLDLRRTIHRSLSTGGEPLSLEYRTRPDKPVRLVIFLDVSGSMKQYSRFFLQFVKGIISQWIEADAYLFHTRLVRVTEALREKDSMKAMTRLSLMAEGFGGGTKLGASLATFNQVYAKHKLNSRSIVLILSDGYDTGSVEDLAKALQQLKKRTPKLIWLNPLLGWQNYEPVSRAMTASLPFIDYFAAANTLETLASIEPEISQV